MLIVTSSNQRNAMAFNFSDLRPTRLLPGYLQIVAITRVYCKDSVIVVLEVEDGQMLLTLTPYN